MLTPLASVTVTPLVAGLPLTVQVGAGNPAVTLQVRLVVASVVVVPALEAKDATAGAWFLTTVIVSVSAPAELVQEIVTVLLPTARLTVAEPPETALPPIVQDGAGVPVTV